MVRTKNQIRSSKSKGAQFEYNVHESLKPVYPDINLTKQLGFCLQLDLVSTDSSTAFELKCHKGFSWNELVKLFEKLEHVAPNYSFHYLILKANRQPVLVMFRNLKYKNHLQVTEFEDYFGVPFIIRGKQK